MDPEGAAWLIYLVATAKTSTHKGCVCRALSRAELPPDADLSDGVLALHDEFFMCRCSYLLGYPRFCKHLVL